MWWNFTEYSVKYIYNVWHLWEANNCYRVLSKNLGHVIARYSSHVIVYM